MTAPKIGDQFPADTKFTYIPYQKEQAEDFKSCGIPIPYNAGQEWQDKKVVLFALPGAFTPTCSGTHLPDYIAKRSELAAKGVDLVAVLASNDPFVMSAWAKANGVKDDSILFLSDIDAAFSEKYGWAQGGRTGRYALVIDHGKIKYAEIEKGKGEVTVSGVDAVLAHL